MGKYLIVFFTLFFSFCIKNSLGEESELVTRVGMLSTMPNVYVADNDTEKGIFPEFLSRRKITNSNVKLVIMRSENEFLKGIKDQKVDLGLADINLSKENEGFFESKPLLTIEWSIISLRKPVAGHDFYDLKNKNKRFVILTNDDPRYNHPNLSDNTDFIEVTDLTAAMHLLNAGAADGFILEKSLAVNFKKLSNDNAFFITDLPFLASTVKLITLQQTGGGRTSVSISVSKADVDDLLNMRNKWFAKLVVEYQKKHVISSPLIRVSIASGVIVLLLLFCLLVGEIFRRKQAELKLKDSLSFWSSLLNSIPNPVVVCNPLGIVIEANEAFFNDLHLSSKQIIGMSLTQINSEYQLTPEINTLDVAQALAKGGAFFSHKTMNINNEPRNKIQWISTYCNSSNIKQGLLIGWYDITEQVYLEKELALALQKSKDVSNEKSVFLARMSHEIRSPMNAILGILESDQSRIKNVNSPLNVAYQSSLNLLDIIGDVLDLSKIESGNMVVDLKNTEIHLTLDNVANTYTTLAETKGLSFHKDFHSVPLQKYLLDEPKVIQILNNVLSNAIKFTDVGGIEFSAAIKRSLQTGDATLEITVKDTGVGIDIDMQEQVLQPYISTSGIGNTGLGLSITSQLITLLSGKLTLQSSSGRGTTCFISIPCKHVEGVINITNPDYEITPRTILVIDDLPANLTVMELLLTNLNHKVILASNGDIALELLTANNDISIILTDCKMPDMDGYTLSGLIREGELLANKQRIIIGCTANAFSEEELICLESGMDGVLIKPITQNAMKKALYQHCTNPLNLSEVQKLTGENKAALNTLFSELIKTTLSDSKLLMELFKNNDLVAFGERLHRLKGGMSIAGYVSGVEQCQSLERALKTNQLDIKLQLLRLMSLVRKFLSELQCAQSK